MSANFCSPHGGLVVPVSTSRDAWPCTWFMARPQVQCLAQLKKGAPDA